MTTITWVLREIGAGRLVVPAHIVSGLEVALDFALAAHARAAAETA